MEPTTLFVILVAAQIAASQLAWWSVRQYFPSAKVCAYVHRHLPEWLEKAHELVTTIPPQLSVSGFFASLVWLPVVAMNMVLLAQVLETIVDGDVRLEIPYVGSYAILALFMAVLFALIQVALAVFQDRAGSDAARWGLRAGLVLTVATECALSVYRAWLIRGGALPASGTVVDQWIGSAGIAFTGAFGVAVPIGECLLGAVAYGQFLEPGLAYLLRVAGGLGVYTGCGLAWSMLGWHPVPPPGAYQCPGTMHRALREMRELTGDVLDHVSAVNASKTKLSSRGRALGRARPLSGLTAESAELVAQVSETAGAWDTSHESRLLELLKASDLIILSRSERRIRETASTADLETESFLSRARQLETELKPHRELPSHIEACCRSIEDGTQQVSDLSQAAGLMDATAQAFSRLIADLRAAQRGEPLPHGDLSALQVAQIRELGERAASHPNPFEREVAQIAREGLVAATAEAEQAVREEIGAAEKARHAAEEFHKVAAAMGLPEPTHRGDLLRLAAELAATQRAAVALHERQHQDLDRLARKIDQKRYVLAGRPKWLWALLHPFGPYNPSIGVFLNDAGEVVSCSAARALANAEAPCVSVETAEVPK